MVNASKGVDVNGETTKIRLIWMVSPHSKGGGGLMVNKKLETLQKQREQIQARIAEVEAKLKSKSRKEDTRLKILVGAAFLNDVEHHPETRAGVLAVLERGITIDRDREFLKTKGWLP
jgi:hypothetical protein